MVRGSPPRTTEGDVSRDMWTLSTEKNMKSEKMGILNVHVNTEHWKEEGIEIDGCNRKDLIYQASALKKDEIIIGCIHCISLIQEDWHWEENEKSSSQKSWSKTVYFYTIVLTNPNKGRFWRKQSQTKVVQKWPSNLLNIWLNKSICLAFLCIIASTTLAWQTFPTKL